MNLVCILNTKLGNYYYSDKNHKKVCIINENVVQSIFRKIKNITFVRFGKECLYIPKSAKY